MSIRSLADFNGCAPWVRVTVLVGTATVTHQGARLVDQVIEVGTFADHRWGLSHGHGQHHPALLDATVEGLREVVRGQPGEVALAGSSLRVKVLTSPGPARFGRHAMNSRPESQPLRRGAAAICCQSNGSAIASS